MTLLPGARLGPYEITSAIGAGGMGEVFRARDTKLNRDVAIKVLPAAFADDPERLARFTREAQTLASLNHPNIAAIYGIEEIASADSQVDRLAMTDGTSPAGRLAMAERTSPGDIVAMTKGAGASRALVMELVEGEDLSAHIARGPIPIAEALPIMRQIAEALEEAHEHGIVHRDLKPANIKVTPDGKVKVLDFGLAKAMDGGGASNPAMSNSPTMSRHMTEAGMIMGTAAYMSPEQARGKAVDRRADIWSFGVVAYEMLTGSRLFTGETVSDTLAAVLRAEPEWTALPEGTPSGLRRLLIRCLKKDPKARLRDIGDARQQIEELASGAPDETSTATREPAGTVPPPEHPARSRALPWATLAVVAMIGLALTSALLWTPWRAGSAPTRAALALTPLSFEQGGQTGAVWSPDGKAVAFAARQRDADPYQVYLRYLASPAPTQITTLAEGVGGIIEWTTSGKILFFASGGLSSVSPVGGEPESLGTDAITTAKLQIRAALSVSRDGTLFAGLFRGGDGVINIWTWSLADSAPKSYEPSPFASRSAFNRPSLKFSPDGRQILLMRNAGQGEEIWLMPYPPDATNPPHRILEGVTRFSTTPTFSWMPDNRHVVISGSPPASPPQLHLADTVSGAFMAFSSGTRAQTSPAVSPDGSRLTFLESETDRDVVSVDLKTAVVTPVIATQRSEQMPAWAARGSALVYVTDRNGAMEIWLRKPDQPDRPLVTPGDFPKDSIDGFMGPALSPDGTRVIYARLAGGGSSLWMSAVAGGAPVPLVKIQGEDTPGSWSPDGNGYVYWHLEGGQRSLNKVKTTGGAEPAVLKAAVNRQRGYAGVPLWSPANDWILHSDEGVKLISPDGATTRELSPTSALAYAFSADGQIVYGLRQPTALGRLELFSMSVRGGPEKSLGSLSPESVPSVSLSPAIRLSLTPDGKSLTYSVVRTTSNLWLMDGLNTVKVR
jgi:serine/threonine protein kinase/Tol biopolymer transport system component